ncbi:MAG: hypothetical protein SFV55_08970 [Haliscomenobacter sp.]|uniref:hypothetical protein n=1 Tax=Haliscomenobacter sp. TaxID=2717303 RepID=UPI0029ABAD17|nr:hypothetical protein [Haliscomenobacter sp.]MDX2068544.1 hypothetical protein [Haliscomenobacter sp.]
MNKLVLHFWSIPKTLALVFLTTPALTQNLDSIEKDLVETYASISSFFRIDYDSLQYYSQRFDEKISTYLEKYPATFKHPFVQLKEHCFIATSADGLLRIYSWDTWLGGTAHIFKSIAQFQSGEAIFLEEIGGMGFFSEIYPVKTRQKTFYLAVSHGIFSTADAGQSLEAFFIEQNELRLVELFNIKGKMSTSISFEFDFYSVVEHPERPLKLIKYDEQKKIIAIPVIANNGAVTELFSRYRFNGRYFEMLK